MVARLTRVVGAPGRDKELEKLFYDIVEREDLEGLAEMTLLFDPDAGEYLALEVWVSPELMERAAEAYEAALREGLSIATAKAVSSDRFDVVTRWRSG